VQGDEIRYREPPDYVVSVLPDFKVGK